MDASVQTAETRGVGAYFTWIQRSDGVNCQREKEKNMNIHRSLVNLATVFGHQKVILNILGTIIKKQSFNT